jgi:hypothetical protein
MCSVKRVGHVHRAEEVHVKRASRDVALQRCNARGVRNVKVPERHREPLLREASRGLVAPIASAPEDHAQYAPRASWRHVSSPSPRLVP